MKDKLKALKIKLYFPSNINLKIYFNRYDKRGKKEKINTLLRWLFGKI
jgi:hypothetical protein